MKNKRAILVYVAIKPTYPTSDVRTFAESAVYILYIFENNFELKEMVYYSKGPICLLFQALSHETVKIFIANNGSTNFFSRCSWKKLLNLVKL